MKTEPKFHYVNDWEDEADLLKPAFEGKHSRTISSTPFGGLLGESSSKGQSINGAS